MSRNYKKLLVWQKSIELVVDVYKTTVEFPADEKYGMKSQINRACVSIACNIAEGAGRNTYKEFSNFLCIAHGSSNELDTLLVIASKVNYIGEKTLNDFQERINEIQRMLSALRKTNNMLKYSSPTPTTHTTNI